MPLAVRPEVITEERCKLQRKPVVESESILQEKRHPSWDLRDEDKLLR